MKYNFEIFQSGDSVRIDDMQLDYLKKNTNFIDNLKPDFSQFINLDHPKRIRSSYIYHGGSIVYELDGFLGVWPEEIFVDYALTDYRLPKELRCRASDYYKIDSINERSKSFIVIKDFENFEVIKILIREKNDVAFVSRLASLKSRLGFDKMFNIFW